MTFDDDQIPDETALIEAVRQAPGPIGVFEAVSVVLADDDRELDLRTREGQEHQARRVELIGTFVELAQAGYFEVVTPANGESGDTFRLQGSV